MRALMRSGTSRCGNYGRRRVLALHHTVMRADGAGEAYHDGDYVACNEDDR